MKESNAAYELLFEQIAAHPHSATAILRAAFQPAIHRLPATASVTCQQTWKPDTDRLRSAGLTVVEHLAPRSRWDVIALVPTRQKQETLGLIALASQLLAPSGHLIVSCPNDLGAKSYERVLHVLFNEVITISKKRCRLMTVSAGKCKSRKTVESWARSLCPSMQVESGLLTAPGMFSWEHPDPGSKLLSSLLPLPFTGIGADLGSGYGFLSHAVLEGSSRIKSLHLVEAEGLALSCARKNLARFVPVPVFHLADVPRWTAPIPLDWIVMNPPFHDGSQVAADVGLDFIRSAAANLRPGGTLYLVANAFLPYEKVLAELFGRVEQRAETGGYKVIFATKHS